MALGRMFESLQKFLEKGPLSFPFLRPVLDSLLSDQRTCSSCKGMTSKVSAPHCLRNTLLWLGSLFASPQSAIVAWGPKGECPNSSPTLSGSLEPTRTPQLGLFRNPVLTLIKQTTANQLSREAFAPERGETLGPWKRLV